MNSAGIKANKTTELLNKISQSELNEQKNRVKSTQLEFKIGASILIA